MKVKSERNLLDPLERKDLELSTTSTIDELFRDVSINDLIRFPLILKRLYLRLRHYLRIDVRNPALRHLRLDRNCLTRAFPVYIYGLLTSTNRHCLQRAIAAIIKNVLSHTNQC